MEAANVMRSIYQTASTYTALASGPTEEFSYTLQYKLQIAKQTIPTAKIIQLYFQNSLFGSETSQLHRKESHSWK